MFCCQKVKPTPSIGSAGKWNVSTCHDSFASYDSCHLAYASKTQVLFFLILRGKIQSVKCCRILLRFCSSANFFAKLDDEVGSELLKV